MVERRNITVTVNNAHDFPEKLSEVGEWAAEILATVPAEYRPSVEIEIESEYDASSGWVKITYQRPQTDAEVAEAARRTAEYLVMREGEERQTLAVLKAKYEPAA